MSPAPPTLREAWEGLDAFRAVPRAHGYPDNLHHLFAPVDQVHAALVALCSSASVSIAGAMYGWDDDEIDALFRGKLDNAHIPVTLALDKTQAGGIHERTILARWRPDLVGNAVVIGQSAKHAISHDKMIVLDGLVTVAGSTNLSDSGESKQNNEATIVWDAVFAAEARARIDLIHDQMRRQMLATAAAALAK
jgi:phosphatidylserine/phosphatidylglycerophosphate/cardiolipin synthase-like enzyme